MSLSGTFDVFSLPEVLRMLASGGKSGTLMVESGTAETGAHAARVELFEGECCGAVNEGDDEPLVANHTQAALHSRLLDVAFETTRRADGGFRFAADEHPRPRPAATTPVEPVLEELEQLQREWDEISAVVPSTDAIPVLAPSLPSDEIVVTAADWALLARLDGATAVSELHARSDSSLIEVCRALAGLVRRGAVELVAAPIAPPKAAPVAPEADASPAAADGPRRRHPRPAPTEVLADVMLDVASLSEPEPAPEPERAPEPEPAPEPALEESQPVAEAPETVEAERAEAPAEATPAEGDRGAMLRLFSALRE